MKELDLIYNILEDNSILLDADFLLPEHFVTYGEVFEKIQKIYHETNYVDLISLDQHDIILPELLNFYPNRNSALTTTKILFDSYYRNLVIGKLKKIQGVNYEDIRDNILSIVDEIDSIYDKTDYEETIESLLDPFFRKIKEIRDGGVPLGIQLKTLPSMNKIIGGIMPTDLIGIYGKEKSSKSTLALEMMLDICVDQKIPGVIFSYEMDNELNLAKSISMRTKIDINHLRNPNAKTLDEGKFNEYVANSARTFYNTKLYLVDKLLNEYEIESKIKKLQKLGVKIVLIDYLMLIQAKNSFKTTRDELNYLSKFFKRLCQKLKIAIILISQSNDTGDREAEAKGLSRDSNYFFYVAKLEVGDAITEGSRVVYNCTEEGEYMVKNRGIRHAKLGGLFITKFQNNIYREKDLYHEKFGGDREKDLPI